MRFFSLWNSALEGAESTVMMASGMCASTVMLLALVQPGGHLVTTTDCYRKTRIFIETFLPKLGVEVLFFVPFFLIYILCYQAGRLEGMQSCVCYNDFS